MLEEEKFVVDDEFKVLEVNNFNGDYDNVDNDENEEISKNQKIRMPNVLDTKEYAELISSLNEKQKKYHDYVTAQIKHKDPFYNYVAGGAGVGKSMLITAITQTIMLNAFQTVGFDPLRLSVL